MSAQKFHNSQLIIDSSGDEVVNLRPDLTGDEEDGAYVLILNDKNLDEELTEQVNDQPFLEDAMERLVREPSDYI